MASQSRAASRALFFLSEQIANKSVKSITFNLITKLHVIQFVLSVPIIRVRQFCLMLVLIQRLALEAIQLTLLAPRITQTITVAMYLHLVFFLISIK